VDGSRAVPRSGEAWGRGASAGVRRHGVVGSGPVAAHAWAVRDRHRNRGGRGLTGGPTRQSRAATV
jgi:hypothetical protein